MKHTKIEEVIRKLMSQYAVHIGDGVDDCAGTSPEEEEKFINDLIFLIKTQ